MARKCRIVMSPTVINELKSSAERYETTDFITADPIQFPHRYTDRSDIEVSAFISAWMAYGSRKVFLKVLDRLHRNMDRAGGPYNCILSGAFAKDCTCPGDCLYRFYKQSDYLELCRKLKELYLQHDSIESLFNPSLELKENIYAFCTFFDGMNGIPVPGSPSANKRLYMFLRWMVRKNSPVDFGIWDNISPRQLIIPLDTHVYRTAVSLGITSRRNADLKTAAEITSAMAGIWPDDPTRGDFALYGMGIDSKL